MMCVKILLGCQYYNCMIKCFSLGSANIFVLISIALLMNPESLIHDSVGLQSTSVLSQLNKKMFYVYILLDTTLRTCVIINHFHFVSFIFYE